MTEGMKLDCYVINLDRSPDRWKEILRVFEGVEVNLIRVSAVDVSLLEHHPGPPEFYERRFRRLIGRDAVPGEIGCYFSHLAALRRFLETDAEFALICEDDIIPDKNLAEVLREACRYAHTWELLRVMKARQTSLVPYATLGTGHRLCTAITDFIYAAGYAVNRRGAELLLKKLASMTIPYDMALMSGWRNIREASLSPGAIVLAEHAKISTMTFPERKLRKLTPTHFFWWTSAAYRLRARIRRYGLQLFRVMKFRCFPPRPKKNKENDG